MRHSFAGIPLADMIAASVPIGSGFPRWWATMTYLPVEGFLYFLWLPFCPTSWKPCRTRIVITS